MISSGLLTGFAGAKEFSITDISVEGFGFRIAERFRIPDSFRLFFYDLETAEYREIKVSEFTVNEKKDKFYFCYQVSTEQKDYQQETIRFMVQYSRYVQLKTEDDDGTLAQSLTGYPAEEDEHYSVSLAEQKKDWFSEMQGFKGGDGFGEIALELDRPELYDAYLQSNPDDFLEKYRRRNYLPKGMWEKYRPGRLYLGNQFCHLLFPDEKRLFSMMEKAVQEGLQVTVSFSYIREYMLEDVKYLLQKLEHWGTQKQVQLEVVVNDWGMARMIKDSTKTLTPCLGILLNKQRKDPRMQYKKGNMNLLGQNSINAEFYREYLKKEYRISRYEWESCGYIPEFPEGGNSLHVPFYQTNTSQYCPLYAACVYGNRAYQKLQKECPGYCEEYGFLYPKHLNMTGRYNSLFALDMEILKEPDRLKAYRRVGADRLVLNFL